MNKETKLAPWKVSLGFFLLYLHAAQITANYRSEYWTVSILVKEKANLPFIALSLAILPKVSCIFNTISMKIPKKTFLQFRWKDKILWMIQIVHSRKNINWNFMLPDFKLYYRNIVIKAASYWHKNRHVDHSLESRGLRNKHSYKHLTFDPDINTCTQWWKVMIFKSDGEKSWISIWR